jgi:hypothetical protein
VSRVNRLDAQTVSNTVRNPYGDERGSEVEGGVDGRRMETGETEGRHSPDDDTMSVTTVDHSHRLRMEADTTYTPCDRCYRRE